MRWCESKRTPSELHGEKQTAGTFSSSPVCGSRIYSITTFDALKCVLFHMQLRKERSRSARTIPELAGARSSKKCTLLPLSRSGTRLTVVTRFLQLVRAYRCH